MRPQSFEVLLRWILEELKKNDSIFGIPRSLFYTPKEDSPYSSNVFGQYLATPVGPGAGPHTQLTQNIVCAWLCGARFIELKTVQINDELKIPRPCIDMEDEGYNVEFSQELKLEQSAWEYINAWALIHILHRLLGFEGEVGTIFNMSVGYDLKGIQSPRVTKFMDRLQDASKEIAEIRSVLREKFPQFADVEIPSRVVNNVTLSTFHGCPPGEIEDICRYLLEERGLHTMVKLNPTLLSRDVVMEILHERLGFREFNIPDAVFEQGLQYEQAVEMIKRLQRVAASRGLTFGVKLSNTMPMENHKQYLPGDEVYMSGRALYPVTINLFLKLLEEFDGGLAVSFAAGADELNLASVLAAGAWSVTAVTDLLKPGGYAKLARWLESLEEEMRKRGARSLEELSRDKLANLKSEAAHALEDPRYKKEYHPHGLPKLETTLGFFDCIAAPCIQQCPVLQDVPEYVWLISKGEYDRALELILARNPLPGVTGYICTHACQSRCTQNNYEEPVAIRALKRFVAEKGVAIPKPAEKTGRRVAVIGSGPSGLAAAYFLAANGVEVVVYEAKDRAGGMLNLAPAFRLPKAVVEKDIERIKKLGVKIELSHSITTPPEELLNLGFDAVYLAPGAPKGTRLGIEGEDGKGVYQAIDFLELVSLGKEVELGKKVLVVGGGNTAMDAARTAKRLTQGSVEVIYRRTRKEMPAAEEEVEGLLSEGIPLRELVSPVRIILENGQVAQLECIRNKLGPPGPDGRRRPVPIPGSEFRIEADSVILAVGQRPGVSFVDLRSISLNEDGTIRVDPATGCTGHERIYAGGDAVRGPATIVEACADGRRAAEAICKQLGIKVELPSRLLPTLSKEEIVEKKKTRARRERRCRVKTLRPEERKGFDLIEATLAEEEAAREAARCLQCSSFCDKCVEVCPNRANYAYFVSPVDLSLPVFSCQDGGLREVRRETFRVLQARQIVHVQDFCNECGNCKTFCVHQGEPYKAKPNLFLNEADFKQAESNAFLIEGSNGGWIIRRQENGREFRLSLRATGEATFESERLRASLSPDFRVEHTELRESFEGEFSLVCAAEMWVLLRGVTSSLPFLPFARRQS
jgi:putative selenate reductase